LQNYIPLPQVAMVQLKAEELYIIEKLRKSGFSGREIGRRMGQDHTVINRELARIEHVVDLALDFQK